jgi:hypothetical protein
MRTCDPESMTSDERRREVAGILAEGLLRCVRTSRADDSATFGTTSEDSQILLDLPAETRLSVAPRPAG